MAQVGLQCAYGAVLAVAFGMLVRSQLLAILGVLGLAVHDRAARDRVPAGACEMGADRRRTALIGGTTQSGVTVFGPLGALALAAGYVALFWGAAVWLERRRDA